MKDINIKVAFFGAISKYVLNGILGAIVMLSGRALYPMESFQSLVIDAIASVIAGVLVGIMIKANPILNGFSTWIVLFLLSIVVYLVAHFGFNNKSPFNIYYYSMFVELFFICLGAFASYKFRKSE
jgi:hypothetical protein